MRLSEVMAAVGGKGDPGADPEVRLATADSREARPGTAFFAVRGTRQDGHDFAAAAAAAGASAVFAARPVPCAPAPLVLVEDPRRALALAAAALHGRPGDRLRLAGVTGTNGKTTVAWLVEACLREAGVPCGMLGTVLYRWPGVERPAPHTTPDAAALQAALAEMAAAGAQAAVLEVSSHALDQERVAGLSFAVAGFTNLTRDHLDYHGDLAAYLAAKTRLFTERLRPDGLAVINAGDPAGARLADDLARAGRRVWRWAADGAAPAGGAPRPDLAPTGLSAGLDGLAFALETPAGHLAIRSPLAGGHNVENLLCAAGLALGLGLPADAVARGLSGSAGAPGRLERIPGGPAAVFVDYAHTDDALARALAALRAAGARRCVVVFGCGGDRDRGKRPLMGEAAGRGAELAVVTSDNPRSEDPLAIIDEVLPGLLAAGARRLTAAQARAGAVGFAVEPDRREAIRLALAAARPGDAVLVAGKGHETTQIVGAERLPFDDREEARRALGLS